MAGDDPVPDSVSRVADEFMARYRRGERPSLSEYAARHPELADRVRQLVPVMVLMEEAGQGLGDSLTASSPGSAAGVPAKLDNVGGYRILREIGRGGMGVVYEAEQVALGRHVALKVLPLRFARLGSGLERFRREAKAAARLHHTNIVPVYEVGEDGEVCYYAMQFIHGQPLDQVIEELRRLRTAGPGDGAPRTSAPTVADALLAGRVDSGGFELPLSSRSEANPSASNSSGPDPPTGPAPQASLPGMAEAATGSGRWHYYRSVARVGVEVAAALEHAHREGVLHRDIKPSNLLLDLDGRVWVTDFGLAKTDGDALTHTGDVIGTIPYMAPERFRGWSDPRSDIYSLGLTLYEMVALRPAFADSDRLHLIAEVSQRDPPRLDKRDPHVPRDLKTIIVKAIDKEPSRRYQTAAELADDLRRFLEDRSIRARQTGPIEQAWRWCRRNPAVALLLIALVSGALSAAGVFWKQRNDLAEQAGQLKHDKIRVEKALWNSKRSQARALRLGGRSGWQPEALRVLSEAAGIEPSLEPEDWRELLGRDLGPGEAARITPSLLLRNEAIACMALTDLRVVRRWQGLSRPDIEEPIDFNPDFKTYARVEDDRSICIRRVADDGIVLRLPAVGKSVCRPIRFSPNGRLLATKQETERGVEFFLWNVKDQTTVLMPVLRGPTRHDAEAIDFSADGRWFAVDTPDGSIAIYDLTTGKEANPPPVRLSDSPPRFARFDPRGERLAVTGEGSTTVQIWDVKARRVVREFQHPHQVAESAWSPDGQWLAVACLDPDDRVSIWNVESGTKLIDLKGHKAGVWAVAFHPHADLLVSYGWDKTRLWDFRGGRELLAVDGWFLRFSSDGSQLAFRNGRQVGLWAVTTAAECRPLHGHDQTATVYCSAFHPNGRLLATCAADGVRLWDVLAGRQVAAITELGRTDSVAFDPVSGGLFTCSRAGLQLWPVRALGSEADRYQVGPPDRIPLGTEAVPRALSLSENGAVLAVDLDSWQAVVIHRREGKPPIVLNAQNSQAGVAVSPDGSWVATGNYKGSGAHVWDSRTGQRQKPFPCGGTAQLTFSPDNQWLILSEAGEAQFYRVGTWEQRPPAEWPSGLGHCLAFTRDAQVMAVHPFNSGLLRLVQAGTGQELATLELTPSPSLITGPPSFSPDGSQLVIHYGQEGLRVWDLRMLRARLAAMRLDWDRPAYPPAAQVSPEPLKVEVRRPPLTREELLALSLRALRKPLAALGLNRPPAQKEAERLGRELRAKSLEHLNALRWQQAIDAVKDLPETDAEGWVLRGRARYGLGRAHSKHALADFNRALELAPGNPDALHYRGHCHERLGQYREAIADFAAALQRSPTDAHLLTRRGLNHLLLGESEPGVADLRMALESRPARDDEIAASTALAWALVTGPEKMRDPASALPLAEGAEKLARESFDSVNTLGVVYYRLGQHEKARNILKRAADLQAPGASNRFFLAMSHHRLGETAEARVYYDQAVAWLKARPELTGRQREQVVAFRAEAEALLRAR